MSSFVDPVFAAQRIHERNYGWPYQVYSGQTGAQEYFFPYIDGVFEQSAAGEPKQHDAQPGQDRPVVISSR